MDNQLKRREVSLPRRDYALPKHPHPSPKPKQQTEPESHAPQSQNRRKFLLPAVRALIIVLALLAAWLVLDRQSSPFPADIRKSVNFALYYPSSLPNGYNLDKNSFTSSSQIVTYSISNGQQNIVFTIQPKPPASAEDHFKGDTEFLTSLGKAYMVNRSDGVTGGLLGDSLLLINPQKSLDAVSMSKILHGLKEVKPSAINE